MIKKNLQCKLCERSKCLIAIIFCFFFLSFLSFVCLFWGWRCTFRFSLPLNATFIPRRKGKLLMWTIDGKKNPLFYLLWAQHVHRYSWSGGGKSLYVYLYKYTCGYTRKYTYKYSYTSQYNSINKTLSQGTRAEFKRQQQRYDNSVRQQCCSTAGCQQMAVYIYAVMSYDVLILRRMANIHIRRWEIKGVAWDREKSLNAWELTALHYIVPVRL